MFANQIYLLYLFSVAYYLLLKSTDDSFNIFNWPTFLLSGRR